MTDPDGLRLIARRVVWWKPPEQVLSDPIDFACRVMTYGTWDDVTVVRQRLGDDLFRAALRRPRPGVFDRRSWRYWHLALGVTPVPPLPKRAVA